MEEAHLLVRQQGEDEDGGDNGEGEEGGQSWQAKKSGEEEGAEDWN